jgi:hypothetical protein
MYLDWLCAMDARFMWSYETGVGWCERAKKYENDYHKVLFVEDWDKINITDRHWGLVLIDHHPNDRRHIDIERVANHANFIVIHDTEPEADKIYHYSRIWNLFKYRYDHKRYKNHTSVVSNFVDVGNLFK